MIAAVQTDAGAAPAEAVRAAAQALWDLRLADPYTRASNGMEVLSLPSGSLEEAEADATRASAIEATLRAIDMNTLAESPRLTLEYLREALLQQARAPRLWWTSSPVTPYASYHFSYYAQQIIGAGIPATAQERERKAGLWSDLAQALRTAGLRLDAQAARGWRLARPALAPTAHAWRMLRTALQSSLTIKATGGEDAARWREAAARLRDHEVLPAIDEVLARLVDADYAARAPAHAGLCHLPDGAAVYAEQIRAHLTIDEDPHRLHQLGHEELLQLAERMRAVRERIGFTGSAADFYHRLKCDPRVIARTPEDVGQRYQRCLQRIEPLLPQWFSRLPKSPCRTQRLEAEQEAGMTYGYYDKPHRVGEEGVYRFNASNLAERSQLQVASLVYHELWPGHHLHLALQMEHGHLPPIRRTSTEWSVFNEGWAEYASGLADEMGLYDDPYDLYGRLVHECFVTQRLVVDTGLNALGWTLERARDFMSEHTLEGPAQVASETLRYATDMPAQALAYRTGYRWFMDLRRDTEQRLGRAFDIRRFHEVLLEEGALPMVALRGHVERTLPTA